MRRVIRTVCLVVAVLPLTTGCVSRLARYTVHVRLSESIADSKGVLPNVETHLLALNPPDGGRLVGVPMERYWDPNRGQDDLVRRALLLGGQHPPDAVLRHTDPIWRRWNADRATDLFVLADLPGTYETARDMNDPRRLVIPLERTRWWFRPRRELWILIDKRIRDVTPRRGIPSALEYDPYVGYEAPRAPALPEGVVPRRPEVPVPSRPAWPPAPSR